jgi:hypothetical protein
VEVAEKFADNLVSKAELMAAMDEALDAMRGTASRTVAWVGDHGTWQAARMIVVSIQQSQMAADAKDWRERAAVLSRRLLRCVFGNPFRSATLPSPCYTWHGSLLVSMAQRMYDARDFADMPILADALEEAGCTNADILNHSRQPGEHVRGCWVADLLLGKE